MLWVKLILVAHTDLHDMSCYLPNITARTDRRPAPKGADDPQSSGARDCTHARRTPNERHGGREGAYAESEGANIPYVIEIIASFHA